MRLYKMELCKLCCRKSVATGFLIVLFLEIFFFYHTVITQSCTIDGITYYALDAVRMDRQITEEFRGELTDEKVSRIVEKYGFPQGIPEGEYDRLPGNFLNTFVMDYLSDGYINSADDYQIAAKTFPLAETALGQSYAAAGMKPHLAYYYGWNAILDEFGLLMLNVSMLILYTVSVVFAEEKQAGTKALLFTTKEGPAADALSKIAAAFSISLLLWFFFVTFHLLLYTAVYGTDGLHCICTLVVQWRGFAELSILQRSVGAYLAGTLFISFLGTLELCAITICVSAWCRSCFHAIVGAGVCYVLPFFSFMLFQSGVALMTYCSVHHPLNDISFHLCWFLLNLLRGITYASPVFLMVNHDALLELGRITVIGGMKNVCLPAAIACALFLFCTAAAWRGYRKVSRS